MGFADLYRIDDKDLSLDGYKRALIKIIYKQFSVVDSFDFEHYIEEGYFSDNFFIFCVIDKIKKQKGKRELKSYLNALKKVLM